MLPPWQLGLYGVRRIGVWLTCLADKMVTSESDLKLFVPRQGLGRKSRSIGARRTTGLTMGLTDSYLLHQEILGTHLAILCSVARSEGRGSTALTRPQPVPVPVKTRTRGGGYGSCTGCAGHAGFPLLGGKRRPTECFYARFEVRETIKKKSTCHGLRAGCARVVHGDDGSRCLDPYPYPHRTLPATLAGYPYPCPSLAAR